MSDGMNNKWHVLTRRRVGIRNHMEFLVGAHTLREAQSVCDVRHREYPDEACAPVRLPTLLESEDAMSMHGYVAPTDAEIVRMRRARSLWSEIFETKDKRYREDVPECDGADLRESTKRHQGGVS